MMNWREYFIKSLEDLRDRGDRAAMASLRRGLSLESPDLNFSAAKYVVANLPEGVSPQEVKDAYVIASLFALHPQAGGSGNLGGTIRRISEPSESIEKRFLAMVDSEAEDLPEHSRQIVGILKSKDIPVDWLRFSRDLSYWDHPDKFVQREWVSAFYTGKEK
jgi:CRISPR system Cascade subunit CasB